VLNNILQTRHAAFGSLTLTNANTQKPKHGPRTAQTPNPIHGADRRAGHEVAPPHTRMRGRACGVYPSCTQPVLATPTYPFEYRIWTTPGAVEVVRSAHALRLPHTLRVCCVRVCAAPLRSTICGVTLREAEIYLEWLIDHWPCNHRQHGATVAGVGCASANVAAANSTTRKPRHSIHISLSGRSALPILSARGRDSGSGVGVTNEVGRCVAGAHTAAVCVTSAAAPGEHYSGRAAPCPLVHVYVHVSSSSCCCCPAPE
jgi:hypothetical protein